MAFSVSKMAEKMRKATVTIASAALIAGSPAAAQPIPNDTWMGIYLGPAKVGYAQFGMKAIQLRGKPAYRLTSRSVTRLVALGERVEQAIDTTVFLNKGFDPTYQVFKMSSAGHSTLVTVKYSRKEIIAEVTAEGSKDVKHIPVPDGARIVGDSTFFSPTMKLKVGDEFDLKCFNPLTLSLDDIHMTVLRREDLPLGDRTHHTFVIKTNTPLGEMTCWQDDSGELWKVSAIVGIVMVREPKDIALSEQAGSDSYTPPADLAVMTSASTNIELPDPRQVKELSIRVAGLRDRSLVISDDRQKALYTPGDTPRVDYDITAVELDGAHAAMLPVDGKEASQYLGDIPYVQPSDPEIKAVAKSVVGDERNSYTAACHLREWVHEHMYSKGNIGIVRSSVDVLHAKTGVCRDYAILYAALARAAGIPTKLASGLIYWKGGFYYHAWDEVFVGKWVPMDSTLPTDFVDATHIKLVEGDATSMYNAVKAMGSIKIEIQSYK